VVSKSRRTFNFGLGASLIAAPFIKMLTGGARAAEPSLNGFAKRIFIFFSPNGTVHSQWRPTGSDATYSFPAGSILEPLTDHMSDLIVVDGIDFFGVANHEPGMSAMLTGGGGGNTLTKGMSLDQYIAGQIGGDDKFASLDLGVHTSAWGASNQTRMSYSGPGFYVPPDDNPISVYERMFGAIGAASGAVDKTLMRRKSILDLVRGELKYLETQVGAFERPKLEQHLEAITKVEKSLTPDDKCGKPEAPLGLSHTVNDMFPQLVKAQTDLGIIALACGMTKVVSLQCSHTVSPTLFSWIDGVTDDHHGLSHKPDSDAKGIQHFVQAERWFSEQFKYVLDSLKATPEPDGDGSMLDHTLVLWCKELGDGRMHDCLSVPFVIAGSAGGYFKTGRYLDYGSQPHQKLLVSICHGMGLKNPTFGDPSHGVGELDGLTS
jgi:hypothetical protein